MPAIDVDVPEGIDDAPMRAQHGEFVKFKWRTVRDETASLEAGRPVHKKVEFVEVRFPGDKTFIYDQPATAEHKRKWRDAYKAFQEGNAEAHQGQPLKEWVGIPEELAEDFIAVGCRTVEQLAALSDSQLSNLGGRAREFQNKAREYLDAKKAEAPLAKMQEALSEERSKREFLEKKLQEMADALEKQSRTKK